jgi:hypothetical protein
MREYREHERQRQRDRDDLSHGLADHLDDFDWQTGHERLVRSGRLNGYPLALKEL